MTRNQTSPAHQLIHHPTKCFSAKHVLVVLALFNAVPILATPDNNGRFLLVFKFTLSFFNGYFVS